MDKRFVTMVNLRLQKAAFAGQVNKFGVNLRYTIIQNIHLVTFLKKIPIANLAGHRVIAAAYLEALFILVILARVARVECWT